jgi:IS30 family transposase
VLGTRGTSALITLVERQSRYSCVVAVPLRTAATITTALTTLVGTLGTDNVKSITWDNGKDLSDHAVLTKYTGVPVYFCDTHSPWQRGTNENTNGVLRWQYPKGATLDLDPAKAAAAAAWLNTRPMPVLSNRTPNDVFAEQSVALQC